MHKPYFGNTILGFVILLVMMIVLGPTSTRKKELNWMKSSLQIEKFRVSPYGTMRKIRLLQIECVGVPSEMMNVG